MENTPEKLVPYSDGSDSDENENSSSFHLRKLLKCEEGAELKEYYSKYDILSPKMAKRLCLLIVNFLFDHEIPGSRTLFKEISNEISMVFIKEDSTTYYAHKKGDKSPSGMLFTTYYNEKRQRKIRSERRKAQRADLHESSVEALPDKIVELGDFSEEIQESVRSLSNDEFDDTMDEVTVCVHWEVSYPYRHSLIEKEMYGDVEKILQVWPHLSQSFGSSLINMDFESQYGIPIRNSLIDNWSMLFEKKLTVLIGLLNDPVKKQELSRVLEITDANTKNMIIGKSLHFLTSPGSRGHTNKWLPSMSSSVRTIFKVVRYSSRIPVEVEKRGVSCKEKNVEEHPLIFGVGEGEDSVNEFVVAFKSIRYSFTDYILALDATFKMFMFFGVKFPPESKNVWVIINELFYKIEMKDVATGRLNSIIRNLLA